MHLNNNTTLELIDASQKKQLPKKQMSPFALKAQRQKFVEERGLAV